MTGTNKRLLVTTYGSYCFAKAEWYLGFIDSIVISPFDTIIGNGDSTFTNWLGVNDSCSTVAAYWGCLNIIVGSFKKFPGKEIRDTILTPFGVWISK